MKQSTVSSNAAHGGRVIGCYRCMDAGCLKCAPIGSSGVMRPRTVEDEDLGERYPMEGEVVTLDDEYGVGGDPWAEGQVEARSGRTAHARRW